jgi:predicted O-methyltransferase YrrM
MHQTPDYNSKKAFPNAPEMWLNEISYIEGALTELSQTQGKLNILEWGSGNSTIYFAKFLKQEGILFKWVAIENFVPWYERVTNMLKENGLLSDVTCYLKSPTLEADKNIQETLDLDDYINFPATLGINYNFIFIDGRKRAECLDKARGILSPDGIVVFHDAEREWYHKGFKNYLNGGEFVTANPTPAARGGIQKLWVGKLPKS